MDHPACLPACLFLIIKARNMKTIIAPTDFSESSLNAVNYAADLAVAVHGKLVLLHVVQVPVTISEVPLPEPVFEDMLRIASSDLENLVVEIGRRTNGKIDVLKEIVMGDTGGQIIDISSRQKPFAVVMGLRSGKTLERFFAGSETLSMIRYLPYPLLIVPEGCSFKGIHKIGLASDLDNISELVPSRAFEEWMSAFNASLDIVHVCRKNDHVIPQLEQADAGRGSLDKFHPKFHFAAGDNVADGLSRFVEEHQLDLLIVIPKKHGIAELFDEKHSKKIVLHQQVPVLVLHR